MTFFPRITEAARPECQLEDPNATVADSIIVAVQAGAPQGTAARWAGVRPETLSRWLRRGADELTRMAKANTETPETAEEPYVNLLMALMTAEADAEMTLIAHWSGHFDKDWRAVQKYMGSRFPGTWGDSPRRLELSGPGGGPVPIAAAVLTADEAEALLSAAEAREVEAATDEAQRALSNGNGSGREAQAS